MKKIYLTLIAGTLALTACGKKELPTDITAQIPALTSQAAAPTQSKLEQEALAAIPKILKGIEAIKDSIDALNVQPISSTSSTVTRSSKTLSSSKTPSKRTVPTKTATRTSSKTKTKSTAKPSSSAPKASLAERSEKEFKTLINKMKSVPFVSLVAEKVEKNLDSGKVSVNKIKMWSKQPNTVKIDIISSTSGSTGVKALYTSGEGDKIKVRPNGGLSFITTDLAKTDERVTSNNDYAGDDIDLFGVAKRLSSGYTAKLIGTTSVKGKKVNILKVTTTGKNDLDTRITHEYLGYEPDTYAIRLWEMYDSASAKEPYYRMTLTSIDFPDSLPASTFKL